MPVLDRRTLLLSGSAAGLLAGLAVLGRCDRSVSENPWGPLIPDPKRILDLPAGFSYVILSQAGDEMDDGYRTPGRPDGMACFPGPDGTLILMRNHEISVGDVGLGPYHPGQARAAESYQGEGMGGVSRVVIDPHGADGPRRISSNLVLVGTARNCAGGPSPWGWLSCEENTEIHTLGDQQIRHGYVFVCDPAAASLRPPQPVLGFGRCNHEAAAVDPSRAITYLSEDRPDSCLYRFVPDDPAAPFQGRLQALAVVDAPGFDLGSMQTGQRARIRWIDLRDTDPDQDTLRYGAQRDGAAKLVRGEGLWWFEDQLYVCSTSGGPIGKGQIFRLRDGPDAPTIELLVNVSDARVLDNPDNITVAPWGELFMVEDGVGEQFVRWLAGDGRIHDFARNAHSVSELTGICFSPDGALMFVNLQDDGLTLAITGPFAHDTEA